MTALPAAFTEYDWFELVAFAGKVNREGFDYAYENYPPRFETVEMQAVAADPDQMRAECNAQLAAIDEWWRVEGANGADLINAHTAEAEQRACAARKPTP